MNRRLCIGLLLTAAGFGRTVDLAGFWDFRYDPEGRGEAAGWHSVGAQTWTRIQVPGSYNQALRNDVLYQGKAWYRTSFEAELGKEERALLRFGAVAIRSKVWVNGKLAGEHLFPYTGFTFDITELVKSGRNVLTVMADNQLLKDAIPDLACTGWWNYGGINRGVWLDIVPAVYARDLSVTTKMAPGGWTIAITAELVNPGMEANATLQAELEDPAGRVLWKHTESRRLAAGEARFASPVSGGLPAYPWSPEHPALYRLRVAVHANGDTFEKTVALGFRQIEVKGTQILLNGRPVFFKGVNYHEMYPGAGMTLSREQVRRDLADMKAMGCNFVRLAHYPHDEQVYELPTRWA